MRHQSIKPLLAATLILTSLAWPGSLRASLTVSPGWDLFQTMAPTDFLGDAYGGVPLNTFDFGSGAVAVGATDTIIQRLATASVPGPVPPSQSATIPIQMNALQLASLSLISFGGGPVGTYYITLQSVRGGPASGGSMTISFDSQVNDPLTDPHGTFSSSLDVFFDVRYAALNGPIVYSSDFVLSSANVPWVHFAPPDALALAGVNYLLDGSNINEDFWMDSFTESHPGVGQHTVRPVPEPGAGAMALMGIGLFSWWNWRRKQQ